MENYKKILGDNLEEEKKIEICEPLKTKIMFSTKCYSKQEEGKESSSAFNNFAFSKKPNNQSNSICLSVKNINPKVKKLELLDTDRQEIFSTKEDTFPMHQFCEKENEIEICESSPVLKKKKLKQKKMRKSYKYVLQKLTESDKKERNIYFSKIISLKIWIPYERQVCYNSLIILDWDDTLFPTSYLKNKGGLQENYTLNETLAKRMKKLEKNVVSLLTSAINKGNTYIITNAEQGWVEYTSNRYFPLVTPLLNQVKVISARKEFGKHYPLNFRMWKICSFLNIVNHLDCNRVTNIVCIGDSPYEMEAGKKMATKFNQVCIKGVKFKDNPRLQEMTMQISLVIKQFNYIYSAVKNWTIRVSKRDN